MRHPRIADVVADIAETLERGDFAQPDRFSADRAAVAARLLHIAAAEFEDGTPNRVREHRMLASLLDEQPRAAEQTIEWPLSTWDSLIQNQRAELRARIDAPMRNPDLLLRVSQAYLERAGEAT